MAEGEQTVSEAPVPKKGSPTAIIIALAVLLGVGGYFLVTRGSQTAVTQEDATDTVTEDESQVTEDESPAADETQMTTDESGATIVNVEGGGFYFKPNEIRVKAGDKVKIVFTNAGGNHDFVIDELGVRTKLTQSGETAEVEFVAETAGEYEYYCSVADHRAKGMVGTLIVE